MPGQMKPKSMSTEEAAQVIAHPEIFSQPAPPVPVEDAQVPPTVTADQLRDLLALIEKRESAVEEREAELNGGLWTDDSVGTTSDDDPDEEGEAPVALREDEEINADIEMIVGPFALSLTPEMRHLAMLRLIDDLVASRELAQ